MKISQDSIDLINMCIQEKLDNLDKEYTIVSKYLFYNERKDVEKQILELRNKLILASTEVNNFSLKIDNK